MGLLGAIGTGVGAWFGGSAGAAAGGAIGGGLDSMVAGNASNAMAADEAQRNREFQADMSSTAYQRAVADLKAAGLNPMLAYQQGGASSPSGSMASFSNAESSTGSTMSGYYQAGMSSAQADVAESQANANKVAAFKAAKEAELVDSTVDKVKAETANLDTEGKRLGAALNLLDQQRVNLVSENYNLTQQREVLAATVRKINAEIPSLNLDVWIKENTNELGKLDVQAAKDLGNLGREAGQLEPLFRILRSILSLRGH